MLSTKEIIEIVFVPVYFILFLVALFSFVKHSRGKKTAFGLLFIFPLIRMVGNILLVVAQEEAKKSNPDNDTLKSLYTAGFILQLAGFGLLFSSALALTNRAILHEDNKSSQGPKQSILSSPSRLLHLLNSVATLLLIIGLAKSTNAFDPSSSDHSISKLADAGTILMLVATVILALLATYNLFIVGPVAPSARIILTFVVIACVPMLARIAFSTYKLCDDALLTVSVWAQLVLQYICECLSVIIILALAFTIHARGGDGDLDERRNVNKEAAFFPAQSPSHSSAYPPQQQQQQYGSYRESYA